MSKQELLNRIKAIFLNVAPQAKVILYGSQARDEAKEGSDYDLMVILDQETISREEEKKIITPLYALEVETGKIISPFVLTERDWEKASHRTTFYQEVMKDGIRL